MVLREFWKRFRRKRPAIFKLGQWHFYQDNTPVHNSILVTDYLTKMGIKTVLQPPYSPDLAPCDFWLFPKFRGCRYETIEEIKESVTKVIDTLTQENFHWAFQKLLELYNKCIAAGGDYFEGDKSFMCVLLIKVPIRKSLQTYLMIFVFQYVSIDRVLWNQSTTKSFQYKRKNRISHNLKKYRWVILERKYINYQKRPAHVEKFTEFNISSNELAFNMIHLI